MLEVFRKYIESRAHISVEELGLIESISVLKKLRKRQYLLQEGDTWKYHAFVTRGCLRTYSVDEKGLEHNIYFAAENWWIGDRESFLTGTPSRFNIEAVEDSDLILFSKANFEMICKEVPSFNDMVHSILDKSFVASQNRFHAAVSYTAKEKYQHFLLKFPGFANRVPLHMIASYLGITAETLSRIRKQAATKK